MFYLLGGTLPFQGSNEMETGEDILKKQPDWDILHKRGVSKKIITVLSKMLKKNPVDRISIEKLIRHKVFNLTKERDSQVG